LKKIKVTVLLLVLQTICLSQTTLSGVITDSTGGLTSVSVTIKDSLSKRIVEYTYSNAKGDYSLTTERQGAFNLVFHALGYKTKTVPLVLGKTIKEIKLNVILEEDPFTLEEVIIKSTRPIIVKKDTITFKTRFFTKGNEQTVEDLLKVIPGLNIDS